MNERSPSVPFVRSALFGYHELAPSIDSQTRYEPAIMWSQVGVGQANLSISYGKMNERRSPVQPPTALRYGPAGPVVERWRLPFWLSMNTRWPCLGSIRANMPSPPMRCDHTQPVGGHVEPPANW